MAIQWTQSGEPFAALEDEVGVAEIMKNWVQNDPDGQELLSKFNTEESINQLSEQLEFHDLAVSYKNLSFVFTILRDSGQLKAPTPPVVPLTSAGVPMTEAQQRWSEYRVFSETHSMREIRERQRIDSGFASFVKKNREREWEKAGDAGTILDGSMRPSSARGRL